MSAGTKEAELDPQWCVCRVSLTKAERGKGAEPVCKEAIRTIDSGIKAEYGGHLGGEGLWKNERFNRLGIPVGLKGSGA